MPRYEKANVLEESLQHAVTAAQLTPDNYVLVNWASNLSRIKGDYASAFRYGKQALGWPQQVKNRLEPC